MRVDFYRLIPPDGVSFPAILRQAQSLADDDSRVRELAGVPFRLQQLSRRAHQWEGELIRIRMNDVPIIVSLSGDMSDVPLKDDEGLGEQTAFLFDEATSVLALQRNRFGISASKFARWFENLAELNGIIEPDMILGSDLTNRLNSMQVIRKYRVRFAGITNPQLLTQHKPGVTDAIRLLSGRVPVVDITVAMGNERGSLPVRATLDAVKKFFKWATDDGPEQVTTLRIEGVDDEEKETLDLLEYRVTEQVDVEVNQHRRMDYGDRIVGLREAWERREQELREMFRGQ